ncbi:MAG: ClpXP protease specificity-enhancing factor [Burkholderiaceae bacterium]
MTQVSPPETSGSSTRPYLIRALHDWCTDNGFTPYLAVHVDRLVRVPMEYVKNNEIVLNVGFEATSGLKLGNDHIEFRARFGGVARDIMVPVDHVVAIYARENGQGMAFPMPTPEDDESAADPAEEGASPPRSNAPRDGAPRGLHLAPVVSNSAEPDAVDDALEGVPDEESGTPPDDAPTPPPSGSRPALKRIK